ncbi:MAG: DUF2202 domain-containing protein [Desulfuromonadaceae bacterium]
MKKPSYIGNAIMIGLFAIAIIISGYSNSDAGATRVSAVAKATATLSVPEAEMLTYMREEEKLARDIYLMMYQKWSAVTFSNIADSEQKHTDTIKKMLDKYSLSDPAQDAIGVFTNADLQGKYDQLLASGLQSYIDGLYVGATIEEIDMIDIQHAIDVTTHIDVINTYQNLLEGSKDHLRAYVRSLAAQGVTYAPQFISREFYDAIINL